MSVDLSGPSRNGLVPSPATHYVSLSVWLLFLFSLLSLFFFYSHSPSSISGTFSTLLLLSFISSSPLPAGKYTSFNRRGWFYCMCFTPSSQTPPLDPDLLIWPLSLTLLCFRPYRICATQLYFFLIYYPTIHLHCG